MFKKNVIFVILVLLAAFFQSCDDGGKKCPEGYVYKDGECVANSDDNDINNPDADTETDLDTEDADTTDIDEIPDDDTKPYTGTCMAVYPDGKLTIDIKHNTLSITSISASDATITLNGDIWLQNKTTASEFKLASVSNATSQTYNIPEGKYGVIYKDSSEGISLTLDDEIDLTSDKTVGISVPMFKFSGAVTKNGAAFPSDITDAEIKISSNSFTKTIPYTSFGSFEIVLPKGSFSMEFKGRLSSTQPVFYGSVGTLEITDNNTSTGINITTKTMSGTFSNAVSGVTVNTGYILLSSGIINTQILDLSSSSSYNVELITNDDPIYYVLYTTDSVAPGGIAPSFQTLTYWNPADAVQPTYIPAEMIPLSVNSVTMNGAALPDFSCTAADCTRGTIKIKSKLNDSFTIAELGKTGAFTPKNIFITRVNPRSWDPALNEGAGGFNAKTPSSFAFFFEGLLFDSNIISDSETSFFTSQLTGYTESVTRDAGDNITEWLTAFPTTSVDIKTFEITGNMTASFEPTAGDLIYASEVIVGSGGTKTYRPQTLVGRVFKDGTYGIVLPSYSYNSTTENPLYDIFYIGKTFLGTVDDFKKTLITSISPTTPALDSKNISISGKTMTLEVTVNGKPLKTFVEESEYLQGASIVIYDSNNTNTYELPINFNGSEPTFDMGGLTNWKVHLKFIMKDGVNSLIVPLQTVTNTSLPLKKNISLTKFMFNVTIDGNIMSDQAASRGDFMFRSKILENSDDPSSTSYFETKSDTNLSSTGTEYMPVLSLSDYEYKDIKPRLTLGEGFPSKHEVMTDCIYVGK